MTEGKTIVREEGNIIIIFLIFRRSVCMLLLLYDELIT